MTVRHRMPGTSSINAGKHGMRHYFDSYPPRLLSVTEIPSWYSNNSFVRSGYRPVTQSVSRCVQSLAYLHNETVNIYTHLVPALVSLAASFFFHAFFLSNYPKAIWQDEVIFQIYLTTTIFCFGISSVYHTLVCHSEGYAIAWVRLDLIAIVFQIIGSVVSGLYMGFYCEPTLQKTYWVMIVVLGTFSGAVNVLTDLDSTKWRLLRLLTLVATGFSALAPIIHAATMFPYWQLDKQTGLRFYYAEGVAMVSGVYFYANVPADEGRRIFRSRDGLRFSTSGELPTRYFIVLWSLGRACIFMDFWMHTTGIITTHVADRRRESN